MARTNWDNNHLQFARLLAELAAVGIPRTKLAQLAESMDLKPAELTELFDRALLEWERAKYGPQPVRKYTPKKELKAYVSGSV